MTSRFIGLPCTVQGLGQVTFDQRLIHSIHIRSLSGHLPGLLQHRHSLRIITGSGINQAQVVKGIYIAKLIYCACLLPALNLLFGIAGRLFQLIQVETNNRHLAQNSHVIGMLPIALLLITVQSLLAQGVGLWQITLIIGLYRLLVGCKPILGLQ